MYNYPPKNATKIQQFQIIITINNEFFPHINCEILCTFAFL